MAFAREEEQRAFYLPSPPEKKPLPLILETRKKKFPAAEIRNSLGGAYKKVILLFLVVKTGEEIAPLLEGGKNAPFPMRMSYAPQKGRPPFHKVVVKSGLCSLRGTEGKKKLWRNGGRRSVGRNLWRFVPAQREKKEVATPMQPSPRIRGDILF